MYNIGCSWEFIFNGQITEVCARNGRPQQRNQISVNKTECPHNKFLLKINQSHNVHTMDHFIAIILG